MLAAFPRNQGTAGCAWVAPRCIDLLHSATHSTRILKKSSYFVPLERLLICGL
jgi:hypothetical protein